MNPKKYRSIQVEDYRQFIGTEAIQRIKQKAEPLQGIHVVNINSTYYGGGVAQLLSSLTLLMNNLGIQTGGGPFTALRTFSVLPRKCIMPSREPTLTFQI